MLHGCQPLRLFGACLVQLTTTNYTHSRASTTASVWGITFKAEPRSRCRYAQVSQSVKKRPNTERMSLIIRRIPQDGEAEDLEEVEELEGSEEAGQETGEGGSRGVGGAYLKPCKMCKARRKVEECVPFF